MTERDAIAYIENFTWSRSRLGLDRTRTLLHALGDPQKSLRFVHVAGSNGKGSTCAMLEAILRRAGYRTGLYTSPYIENFRERIQLSGEPIPGDRLAAVTERVAAAAEAMEDHPSQFELVTAVGMVYFAEAGCDIVVLEVGMGGALDSTNVIDAPEAAVITNLGLEHTEYLGGTLAEIARTKAGIVKPGTACVLYDADPEASSVVEAVCREKNVPLTRADFSALHILSSSLDGQRITYRGADYDLALLGPHQARNAAVVLETINVLRHRGWTVPAEAVAAGLSHVRWPARMEVLGRKPLFLLDGGHNPQCAEALARSLGELLPERKFAFLLGVLADKDLAGILAPILPLGDQFFCLTPQSDRALPAGDLAERLAALGHDARAFDDISAGISTALEAAGEEGVVVSFGSLYLAGAVRSAFPGVYKAYLRRILREKRSRLTPMRCGFLSDRVTRSLLHSPELEAAKTVMLYRAMRGEVRLQAIASALGREKDLVYPRCLPDGTLEVRRLTEPDAWISGPFGIEEPDPERSEPVDPRDIDLVICPCLGFDPGGHRLGMGGGYYDRFLPRCETAFIAAAAFEFQKVEALPSEPWDRAVDAVFTEQTIYRP